MAKAEATKVTQLPIQGTQRGTPIPAITKAAEQYIKIRDKRMELTEKEVEAQAKLLEVMDNNSCTEYFDDDAGIEVSIRTKRKAKAKRRHEEEEE